MEYPFEKKDVNCHSFQFSH